MASKSLKRFRGRLIFWFIFFGVVEEHFCRGFCEFWVCRTWFLDAKSWWVCGENVAGNDSKSIDKNMPLF
jgi:hypothetical protein